MLIKKQVLKIILKFKICKASDQPFKVIGGQTEQTYSEWLLSRFLRKE